MYCYHCGKEIANEALMCPNCGAPTQNSNMAKQEETAPIVSSGVNVKALSAVGLILSAIAFVTGIIFGAFFFTYSYSMVLLYILSGSTILPALAGLSIGVYVSMLKENNNTSKACAICSIVFTSIVLLFLFVGGCVIAAGAL